MKWVTHKVGAACTALLLHLSPLGVCSAIVGGVLPDFIDQQRAAMGLTKKRKQKIFNSTHRGSSHWFGWWLALFLICASIQTVPVRDIAAGLALGGLSHIAMDMLTTRGVPMLPATRHYSVSLRFCSTGNWREYVFLAVVLLLALFLAARRWLFPHFQI